jgi:hypothetical protein
MSTRERKDFNEPDYNEDKDQVEREIKKGKQENKELQISFF